MEEEGIEKSCLILDIKPKTLLDVRRSNYCLNLDYFNKENTYKKTQQRMNTMKEIIHEVV